MHSLSVNKYFRKENKIRLDEHRFYVDVEYVLFPVPDVERVTYYPMCVYMYRLARISQSVSIQDISEAYAGPYGCDPATD